MSALGWIGIDLDGTLAVYNGWINETHIGVPIPAMVDRVRRWLDAGWDVRIFTARVSGENREAAVSAVERWCREHLGRVLPITNVKDLNMVELWDDRCVAVESNTGVQLCASTRGLQ
jgi:hypothetical protein